MIPSLWLQGIAQLTQAGPVEIHSLLVMGIGGKLEHMMETRLIRPSLGFSMCGPGGWGGEGGAFFLLQPCDVRIETHKGQWSHETAGVQWESLPREAERPVLHVLMSRRQPWWTPRPHQGWVEEDHHPPIAYAQDTVWEALPEPASQSPFFEGLFELGSCHLQWKEFWLLQSKASLKTQDSLVAKAVLFTTVWPTAPTMSALFWLKFYFLETRFLWKLSPLGKLSCVYLS